MKRRHFLKLASASLMVWQPTLFSQPLINSGKKQPKLIWIVLRGAVDSLHTIVPTFDANLPKLRPTIYPKIKPDLLPLSQGYALHPALKTCHQWFKNNEFCPIIATGTGYPERSHFDGQDYLENGSTSLNHDSGWLGRALEVKHKKGLAIARSTPISLRGKMMVNTWYPSNLKDSSDDLHERLMSMYQYDETLNKRLIQGMEMESMAGVKNGKFKKGQFLELSQACAKLMSSKQDAIDCAMLEMTGWDTHNNQVNRLNRQFLTLDAGLASLKDGLGQHWANTLVVIATEFGRTAKENGTQGTDHGTGSAMMLAGGSLRKGQVLGKWPGLKPEQLFKQRDLQPTTDTFSWLATLLKQHWHFDDAELAYVFPKHTIYRDKIIA